MLTRLPLPHPLQDRQQIIEVGQYGLQQEVEQLKRDKNVLMQEVIRLRQQQQVCCSWGEGGRWGAVACIFWGPNSTDSKHWQPISTISVLVMCWCW